MPAPVRRLRFAGAVAAVAAGAWPALSGCEWPPAELAPTAPSGLAGSPPEWLEAREEKADETPDDELDESVGESWPAGLALPSGSRPLPGAGVAGAPLLLARPEGRTSDLEAPMAVAGSARCFVWGALLELTAAALSRCCLPQAPGSPSLLSCRLACAWRFRAALLLLLCDSGSSDLLFITAISGDSPSLQLIGCGRLSSNICSCSRSGSALVELVTLRQLPGPAT